MFSRLLALISVLALSGPLSVFGQTYLIKDNIVGDGFYSAFTFEAIADPTDGRVYVIVSKFHNPIFTSDHAHAFPFFLQKLH